MRTYETEFVAGEWDVACSLELSGDGRFDYSEHWTCALAATGGYVRGSWWQEEDAVVLRPELCEGATLLRLPIGEERRAQQAGGVLDCGDGYRLELREEAPADPAPTPPPDHVPPSASTTAAAAPDVASAAVEPSPTPRNHAPPSASATAAAVSSAASTASTATVPPAPREPEESSEALRRAGLRVPPPELAGRIRELVAELPAGAANEGIMRLCRSNGMLPLAANSIYLWGLRPDGVVLCVDHESFAQREEVETDPFTVYAAMMQGVQRHPELQPLIPERPPGMVRCEACDGRGYIQPPGQRIADGCLRCAGVGWHASRAAAEADQSSA